MTAKLKNTFSMKVATHQPDNFISCCGETYLKFLIARHLVSV